MKDGSWPGSSASDDDCFHPALTVASAHLVPGTHFAFYPFRCRSSWNMLFREPAVSVSLDFRGETH